MDLNNTEFKTFLKVELFKLAFLKENVHITGSKIKGTYTD